MTTELGESRDSIASRVAHTEKTLAGHSAELSHIRSSLTDVVSTLRGLKDEVTNEFSQIRESMSTQSDRFGESSKTNWGVLISGFAVTITVYSLTMQNINQRMELQFDAAKDLEQLKYEHTKELISIDDYRIDNLEDWRLTVLEDRYTRFDAKNAEDRYVKRFERNEKHDYEHRIDGHPQAVLDKVEALKEALLFWIENKK